MKDIIIHIGIGTRMLDYKNVILSYKRAYAAQQMAQQFDCPLMSFDEMGVYQLLFLIEDHQVLEDMYHQLLNPISCMMEASKLWLNIFTCIEIRLIIG